MALRAYVIAFVLVLLAFAGSFLYLGGGAPAHTSTSSSASCQPPLGGRSVLKSQLQSVTFGAVTEFALPSPARSPNAITVAPDGSVWFGEQAVPGVGHLDPNGTLVEYAWPFHYAYASSNDCSYEDSIWGIALWNGSVWATDVNGNQLVGLDPATGSVTTVKLAGNDSFPISLTVGPDNSLWVSELSSSQIGRIYTNGTLVEYTLRQGGKMESPTWITFANSTLGYYVSVGGVLGGAGPAVYAFDPQHFAPYQVAKNATIIEPDSIAVADGGLWIDQHSPSIIAFYDLKTGRLIPYPTSTINYTSTTLPYFIAANDSHIWFNEHYANRMGVIDYQKGTLTEYSEADPPVTSGSKIDNTLTFALSGSRAWFTEWTGNSIGYVNAGYQPSFSAPSVSNSTLTIPRGGGANITVDVEGRSSAPLSIEFSDSETFGAIPKNISLTSSVNSITLTGGEAQFIVTVRVAESLQPGNYMLVITVTDGLIFRSSYIYLTVPAS